MQQDSVQQLIRTSKAGVIGAGSFGSAIANLLALNMDVLLFSRNQEIVDAINQKHEYRGMPYRERITATHDPARLCGECYLIYPVVPSNSFRAMMRTFSPWLHPYHLMIHGTKGFDTYPVPEALLGETALDRTTVSTMSEVILAESAVLRVGCLSGPNLSREILEGQPTATVIASQYEEVIAMGKASLNSSAFHVFGSADHLGAELAGALKNIIALGSGVLGGLGMGKNIQAMLLTRGLHEMIHIGRALGSDSHAFIGTAGIGDLIATATSEKSRNYSFGMRLAAGERFEQIRQSMPELAEGVRTLQIVHQLSRSYKLHVPISQMLYKVVFEGFDMQRAIHYLMRYPYDVDVDFEISSR